MLALLALLALAWVRSSQSAKEGLTLWIGLPIGVVGLVLAAMQVLGRPRSPSQGTSSADPENHSESATDGQIVPASAAITTVQQPAGGNPGDEFITDLGKAGTSAQIQENDSRTSVDLDDFLAGILIISGMMLPVAVAHVWAASSAIDAWSDWWNTANVLLFYYVGFVGLGFVELCGEPHKTIRPLPPIVPILDALAAVGVVGFLICVSTTPGPVAQIGALSAAASWITILSASLILLKKHKKAPGRRGRPKYR